MRQLSNTMNRRDSLIDLVTKEQFMTVLYSLIAVLDTNIPKSQRSEFSGIIDELKNEVTNALYQIREIQGR